MERISQLPKPKQQMAQVLGVGADVPLGMAHPRKVKRHITQLLDTFSEREKLKQRVNAQEA